jgi:hypothetical protein
MRKLTKKYKKKNSSKSMKKHKVSKKSRKSRNKKIIYIKKNSRKQRRVGGGGDGDSDDELDNIESGKSRIYSISGDPDDIESGRESITPVITRKIKIPSAKPSPTARTQSPFVSIFSGFSGSLGDLTNSISPYPRKISNISPNISSSSADSEEGGIINTSVPLPKYDEQLSGIEVHTDEYQAYLTNPTIKSYKPMAPLVFESLQKQFSSFLDNLGYDGVNKEELMNKLTDPGFIHNLDTIMNKMGKKEIELKEMRNTLINETQKNARESLVKDIKERIKNANK